MNGDDRQPDGPVPPEGLSAETKVRLLLDLSRKVRGTLDLGETLDRVLDAVRPIVEYDAAGIFVLNEDVFAGHRRGELIAGVARRGFEERPPGTDPMLSRGLGITGHVIRTGESVVAPDVRLDSRYVVGRASTLSEIAVPITVGERTIGALNLESDRCGAFGEGQLEALRFFAEAAAVAVDRAMLHRSLLEKRELEAQLRVAHQVQSRLLPQGEPSVEGYDVAAVYIPSWELAGDYYDFFRLPGGRLGVVVADVAGKGVPAALIMATFRALLRAHVASGEALARIAGRLNRLLRDDCRPHGFVTCFLAELELATGRLTYVNCGHVPPLLVGAGAGEAELSEGGPVLGVFEKAAYVARSATLEPGQTLVLLTDGASEARRPDGEELGAGRIRAVVREGSSRGARAVADEIVTLARVFTGSTGFEDDFTLVLLARRAGG
ncbi:MAG: PP2C family protein-serine/threonine phosphatase [Thermoanaerobaculia bacterium]|nr:PP2C family protein-serine/threonine phosphatase [Thermoanaerobaculia bacterium]